jgi:orotate phosphoribosyltransferase
LLSTYSSYRRAKARFVETDDPFASRLYLRTLSFKRNLEGKQFSFVSVDQASLWTLEWIKTFPSRYDLVVGVPRSGMFVASLIALKLGKGLATPELLRDGQYWHSSQVDNRVELDDDCHVLLVDDSVHSGKSMSKAVETIRSVNPNVTITRASLIIREDAESKVDLFHKIVEPPRVFEWNILHRKIASQFYGGVLAVDMDGVLCADCPPGVDDDEKLYLEWLPDARPYLIPAFEIDAIVTSRLEKYRPQTEEWLSRHKVRYKELFMWDIPSKADRKGQFARHKVDTLLRVKPDMFWESTWSQSQKIWDETRIPTLCIDEMTLLS